MATRLTPLLRRSFVATRTASSAIRGGSPPLPPFTRIPAPTQQLSEQNDVIFDDGVAPELALDFDCQHISSSEGLLSWAAGLSCFVVLYFAVDSYDPTSYNPAVNRKMNMVVESPKCRLDPVKEAPASDEEE
eukprot:CAMPEP_0202458088 /NCGR_PEP_ID=MMETSP1360-20130828/20948_1 /ASSEMBLY_ACC=CAM_ASM_000848 /TAXON_ID=515479 /ORGANISM="Licmophora paradoxa, Strain CCMP2313" /LENGTH=131 /DNA_ID=CAMNT_0049078439 /DNA_START=33 /DNA_END=428 /DNA_ORIENTATION=-